VTRQNFKLTRRLIVFGKLIWIAAFIVATPLAAQATAFKCTDSAGRLTFTDTPCPSSSTKGEKVMDRGAGFNPLSAEEKRDFRKGILALCRASLPVCECLGDNMAQDINYEEAMQLARNPRSPPASVVAKVQGALKYCASRESQP
jgi:hypothetical protein